MTECKCKCGYTCRLLCGLDMIECMEKHWIDNCDHVWSRPSNPDVDDCGDVVCLKCDTNQLVHDVKWASKISGA